MYFSYVLTFLSGWGIRNTQSIQLKRETFFIFIETVMMSTVPILQVHIFIAFLRTSFKNHILVKSLHLNVDKENNLT